ncbi:Crp/Fnr family transcriptional regulator [Alkalihalobacterium chitinilyticum]|uniref:Crp/Fnr family transcriptional regulator n=1 Tax=Alkalihalobacterium chitinilyticum TaxID=2980103 RepID=A0ABT5VFV6_9BACI|nr:Crp/Fnr family transcriptional regulator [Alkalihalobacterium chitinilyticum]MDE5414341.1 Crp/Fnr family transcriptional regulator [Alkalihalobacterium chitinilyticum]
MLETNQLYPSGVIHLFHKARVDDWKNNKTYCFKKGEQITYPGKLTDEIYLVVDGNARIFHVHPDGKECVLGLLSEGDFIDLSSAFIDKESDAYSIALTEVMVVKVRIQEIREEVIQTPDLALALLHHFSTRLRDVVHILEQVAYEKVEERLINLFKKLMDPKNEVDGWLPLPPFITHKDIAGMIASTRETVTFLINKLSQNEVIRNENSRLWISKKSVEM